jgi:putative Holliday junction resolvase
MTAKARRFGQQLQGRFALPVAWVDERYTSAVLENEPNLAPQAKDQLDSHAACLILEQYFQENPYPVEQNKA